MIRNWKVFAILLAVLSMTFATTSATTDESFCPVSREMETTCGKYAFKIVKPLLEYFAKVNNEITIKDTGIKELKQKIANFELKEAVFANLQTAQKACETKVKTLNSEISIIKGTNQNVDTYISSSKLLIADKDKRIAELNRKDQENLAKLNANKQHIADTKNIAEICKTDFENSKTQFRDEILLKNTMNQNLLSNLAQCQGNATDKDVELHNKNNQIAELNRKDQEHLAKLNENKQQIADIKNIAEICKTEFENSKKQCRDEILLKNTMNQNLQSNLAQCQGSATDKDVKLHNLQNKLIKYQAQAKHIPSSCIGYGYYTGIRAIQVGELEPFLVSCDSNIAGPGWTVIQRRIDGKVDFNRTWEDYKQGFGDAHHEYWIGLERLYLLTNQQRYEFYIQVVYLENNIKYAKYDNFEIECESDKYRLISLGEFKGNGWDSLRYHEGQQFSTPDNDNDASHLHCADLTKSGWWYRGCDSRNLNGGKLNCYFEEIFELQYHCIYWRNMDEGISFLKSALMMIRPYEYNYENT